MSKKQLLNFSSKKLQQNTALFFQNLIALRFFKVNVKIKIFKYLFDSIQFGSISKNNYSIYQINSCIRIIKLKYLTFSMTLLFTPPITDITN